MVTRKTFVLDTNVLLHHYEALNSFGPNTIVIPECVLEELDDRKRDKGELGYNARQAARYLDKLRERGKLYEGVQLDNGGILKVELNYINVTIPASWDIKKVDNRILQICKGLQDKGHNVSLVTKDIFERIKAEVLDIVAEDFEHDQGPILDEQYRGRIELYANAEAFNAFAEGENIENNEKLFFFPQNAQSQINYELEVNQFIILRNSNNPKQTLLGRFDGRYIVPLIFKDIRPYGVKPINMGQHFMQEALCTAVKDAPLVIFKGPAGTAKTFYSLAVGLHKKHECEEMRIRDVSNSDNDFFRKILICRPHITMDEDLGALPGDEKQKLAPYLRPIVDNLEILVDSNQKERYKNERELNDKVQELFERGWITIEGVGFLRGRSINNQWIIVDEAQNLTPRQVKAIITRAGVGTKIVLCGDPDQIDHPFLDSRTNGVSYAAERMKGSPYCWQITLNQQECVRSSLSVDAVNRMK